MANEDVQSQHVVTVNRSKVMLGTNDAGMGAKRGWVRGCHIPGDASSAFSAHPRGFLQGFFSDCFPWVPWQGHMFIQCNRLVQKHIKKHREQKQNQFRIASLNDKLLAWVAESMQCGSNLMAQESVVKE